ncbi:MAG: inositol 2-dehydrogenase [Rhizobiaceae bacterium]|nr:inositol 2-dehydrogenase [Rhizobiaceae bacterium]
MLNIGIIGCGRIGAVHGHSVKALANAQTVAVSDPFAESAKRLAETLRAEVRSSDEIIAARDIDAVIIATPTTTHYDLIHAAARAGKAIFCEKPIDMSADRIRDCMQVISQTGVPFMTGFNRRFDGNFSNVQARIASGEIGDVELVTILSRDPAPPPIDYIKTSGGIFRDMMIHDFDMARFLLGEEVASVYAVGSALVDPAIGEAGDVDTAAVTLKTVSGRLCQISNSRRASYGYDQRLEVHGSKGMLRADNQLENSVEIATGGGFARAPAQHFFLERYHGAYVAELKYFADCLEAGDRPAPTVEDGLRAQLMADAAALSLETGNVVALAP